MQLILKTPVQIVLSSVKISAQFVVIVSPLEQENKKNKMKQACLMNPKTPPSVSKIVTTELNFRALLVFLFVFLSELQASPPMILSEDIETGEIFINLAELGIDSAQYSSLNLGNDVAFKMKLSDLSEEQLSALERYLERILAIYEEEAAAKNDEREEKLCFKDGDRELLIDIGSPDSDKTQVSVARLVYNRSSGLRRGARVVQWVASALYAGDLGSRPSARRFFGAFRVSQ